MSISGQPPEDHDPSLSNQHLHALADETGAALNQAKERGAEQYENLRERATEQIDSLAEGAESAAAALEGNDSLGLSQYLGQLAGGLSAFAEQVREQSAEDLLRKGTRLARENPALFLAGSVAIGFGLSRFLRATASHDGDAPAADGSAGAPPSEAPPGASVDSSSGLVADPLGEVPSYPTLGSNLRGIE
jgi:hypothetical protein